MAIVDLSKSRRFQPAHRCGNCGRMIGAMEQPYQWGDGVVCPQCCGLLQSSQTAGFELQATAFQSSARPRPKRRQISRLGITSAIVGGLGIGFVWLLPLSLTLAIVGLVFGIVGCIVAANDKRVGRGMPVLGIAVSLVPFILYAVLAAGLIAVLAHNNTAVRDAKAPVSTEPQEDVPRPLKNIFTPSGPAAAPKPSVSFPPRHLPAIDAHLEHDINQEDAILTAYGEPDQINSNEDDKPHPTTLTKVLNYNPQQVRIFMVCNDDEPRPRAICWAITAYQDSLVGTQLTKEEAEKRMATRVPK